MIADTQPQAEYVPAETTARPTPAPIIPDYDYNEPIVEVTEEPVGYNYPVPDVTLPIRPVTTTQVCNFLDGCILSQTEPRLGKKLHFLSCPAVSHPNQGVSNLRIIV